MLALLHRTLALLALILPAHAQFGGTGWEGAWAPTGSAIINPDEANRNGEFHFTSFHVPAGTTTTIGGSYNGQPAKIFVQGDAQIDGVLFVNFGTSMGEQRPGYIGYPGSCDCSHASYSVDNPSDSQSYNSPYLHLPLGGASGYPYDDNHRGGGFLELEAAGSILITGGIQANGLNRGAGGAICLRSQSLIYLAPGGHLHAHSSDRDNGYIRVESSVTPILEGEMRPLPHVDSSQRMLGDVWTVTSEAGDAMTQFRPFDGSQLSFPLLDSAFGVTSSLRGAVWVSFPALNQIHPYGRDGVDLLPGRVITTGTGPRGIAVDRLDRVWVACSENHRLYYHDPAGRVRFFRDLAINPYAVAVDQEGHCWVTCTGGGKLYEVTNNNVVQHDLAIGDSPKGVAVDVSGNIWVAIAGNLEATEGFIKKVGQDGTDLGTFQVGFRPNGVAVDASGRVWVANEGDILTNPGHTVTALDLTGGVLGTYEVGLAPSSISLAGDGTVWVTNSGTPFNPASSLMQLDPTTGTVLAEYVLTDRSVSFGDATGYQAAMFIDPMGDADGDNTANLVEIQEGVNPFDPLVYPNSDCNSNGTIDTADIASGTSQDCNFNGIPDECDISLAIEPDCNGNGIPDSCDIEFGGFSTDCNFNTIPDECDVAADGSLDLNGNGILDYCECRFLDYCASLPNSTGNAAKLIHSGTLSALLNNLTLITTGCPPDKFGIYFYGPGQTSVPFGDGVLCVGSPYNRLPLVFTGPNGVGAYSLDYTDPAPPGLHIGPNQTWNFQFWFRDPGGPLGSGFNLSNALELTFCP